MWVVSPITGLIEPTPAPVIWIDDIGAIALNDGIASIYYVVRRPDLYGGEAQQIVELIVQRRLSSVLSGLPKMFTLAQRLIACREEYGLVPGDRPPPTRPHLVT